MGPIRTRGSMSDISTSFLLREIQLQPITMDTNLGEYKANKLNQEIKD